MRWILSIFLVLMLISPASIQAQEFNAGFVKGLWYSKESIFAGKTVRVYVAIRNNTGSELTGTVEFFDGETRIERNNVSALNGRIIESWADWTPTYGSKTISATLSRTEIHTVGTTTRAVEVTSSLAEDIIFVDYDTDDDGIGNKDDIDDDGDGISDEVEETNGTDPLVPEEEVPEEPTDDTQENSAENNEGDTKNESGEDTSVSDTANSEGFEQYFGSGFLQNTLSGTTQLIQNTKRNLDAYREKRLEEMEQKNKPAEVVEVNDDGFGEIVRVQENSRPKAQAPEIKEGGFIATALTISGNIFGAIYTGALAGLSFFLGNPALVQFIVLILILFILYKTAQRMSRRPR